VLLLLLHCCTALLSLAGVLANATLQEHRIELWRGQWQWQWQQAIIPRFEIFHE
jgi:hypothetical protein